MTGAEIDRGSGGRVELARIVLRGVITAIAAVHKADSAVTRRDLIQIVGACFAGLGFGEAVSEANANARERCTIAFGGDLSGQDGPRLQVGIDSASNLPEAHGDAVRVVLVEVVPVVITRRPEAHRVAAGRQAVDGVTSAARGSAEIASREFVAAGVNKDADALDRVPVPVTEPDGPRDRAADEESRVDAGPAAGKTDLDQPVLGWRWRAWPPLRQVAGVPAARKEADRVAAWVQAPGCVPTAGGGAEALDLVTVRRRHDYADSGQSVTGLAGHGTADHTARPHCAANASRDVLGPDHDGGGDRWPELVPVPLGGPVAGRRSERQFAAWREFHLVLARRKRFAGVIAAIRPDRGTESPAARDDQQAQAGEVFSVWSADDAGDPAEVALSCRSRPGISDHLDSVLAEGRPRRRGGHGVHCYRSQHGEVTAGYVNPRGLTCHQRRL